MTHNPIIMWECTACGAEYETETGALECSCHGIRQVFICPICKDYFHTMADCSDCIDDCADRKSYDQVEEVDELPPDLVALEAAGQQRLLP